MGMRKPREGIVVRGTERKYEDTGRLDHIAFAATDVDGVRKRLQSRNIKFRESIVPRTGDTQFFLYDPDGIGLELNFAKTRDPSPMRQPASRRRPRCLSGVLFKAKSRQGHELAISRARSGQLFFNFA